jgi:hypothetical protein
MDHRIRLGLGDALRRNVTCRCAIAAPLDKRRYQSRMSWLLEQLPEGKFAETMLHIEWDGGQRTCVSLSKLKKDENEGRVDGALPVTFELSRSFDLGQKFAGSQVFVEGVDSAVWSFCDTLARHLHEWQPPSVRADEPAEESVAASTVVTDHRDVGAGRRDRIVVRKEQIPGGSVTIFDNRSIALTTSTGTQWFRNYAELERSLRGNGGLGTTHHPSAPGLSP